LVNQSLIEQWFSRGYGDGSGDGYGDGHGYRHGYGDGDGHGYGDGDGDGYGYGDGYGDGHGYRHGYGYGYSDGYGDGHGDGYGYGDGSGIETVNGNAVYKIDGLRTVITSIKGDLARGAILRQDLSLADCFIARSGFFFAHGKTAREALSAAVDKSLQHEPIESRIERFLSNEFPMRVDELSRWHNILTGSCAFGRAEFIKAKGLNDGQELTLLEFCEIARGEYGGEIIKQVEGRL